MAAWAASLALAFFWGAYAYFRLVSDGAPRWLRSVVVPASLMGLALVVLLWAPRPTALLREMAFAQNRAEYQQAVRLLEQSGLRTDAKRANYAVLPANLQHLSACGGGVHFTTAPAARVFFYSSSDRFHTANYLYTADGQPDMPGALSLVGGWRCSPLAEPLWFLCVFAT